MKKLPVSFAVLVCLAGSSCWHNNKNIDITYSNSDRYYSMKAYFDRHKTRAVEEYMERKIGRRSNVSFELNHIDGNVILDDNTHFYLAKSPGKLMIKLDKEENTEEAYEKIRLMCEGIKPVVLKGH